MLYPHLVGLMEQVFMAFYQLQKRFARTRNQSICGVKHSSKNLLAILISVEVLGYFVVELHRGEFGVL